MKFSAIASAAAVALSFAVAPAAQAATFQVISGDTTGGPTFDRPFADFSDLSPNGAGVHYSTYAFSVAVTGDYFFNTTATFDSFVFLYQGAFNPTDQLSNGVAANDDLYFGTTYYSSGVEATLTAGSTYTYVVAGFGATDFGAHSTTIVGAGLTAAVPEVQTYLMMVAGLAGIGFMRRRQSRQQ